jgi:actinorhodin biosynthesis protein ActVIA
VTSVTGVDPELTASYYPEIQHFYARQMQLLDAGLAEDFAATFTMDAEFSHSPGKPPAWGREGIIAECRAVTSRLGPGVVRRHWFSMIVADPFGEGGFQVTLYAFVITTKPGESPVIGPSCVAHDILARDPGNGRLLLRSRRVDNDGALS